MRCFHDVGGEKYSYNKHLIFCPDFELYSLYSYPEYQEGYRVCGQFILVRTVPVQIRQSWKCSHACGGWCHVELLDIKSWIRVEWLCENLRVTINRVQIGHTSCVRLDKGTSYASASLSHRHRIGSP